MQRSDFGGSFVWGTATAAYQIEGAVSDGGRGPSIWDTFTRKPGAILGGDNGDIADDHYHRVGEDVALLADLGINAYRFSISWPRIQPDGTGPGNRTGLGFYRDLAEQLLAHSMTPWVTLYHWDLPQALEDKGGWLERETAYRFADYSAIVAEELGDIVTNWITLNEPWCSAFLGYASGVHAPGRQVATQSAHAAHHLLLGHGLAVPRIRRAAPEARVGITLNLYPVNAASDSEADRDAARRIDGLSNRFFLDPLFNGTYPTDVIADLDQVDWFTSTTASADLDAITAPIDFLGINYYSRHTVVAGSSVSGASAFPGSESVQFIETGAPQTQMGWEIHPDGLIDVLAMAHEKAPQLPLYVTENGSAYEDIVAADGTINDEARTDYLSKHIDACKNAIEREIPLAGYFVWSFIDNFEWAMGYSRRFGIVFVDYATQVRTPKRSALWYAEFLGGRLNSG